MERYFSARSTSLHLTGYSRNQCLLWLRVSQPWALGLLIIRGRYAVLPESPPSGDCDSAYQSEPTMVQRGAAPPLLWDRPECCCLPPKLNDPGSFCFCRVAWPRARHGDLIEIRGCAVCLWAWQLLELEALGLPHSLEFQRVRESPQRLGLAFLFHSVCVHCELWPSLMKMYVCDVWELQDLWRMCVCLCGAWGS